MRARPFRRRCRNASSDRCGSTARAPKVPRQVPQERNSRAGWRRSPPERRAVTAEVRSHDTMVTRKSTRRPLESVMTPSPEDADEGRRRSTTRDAPSRLRPGAQATAAPRALRGEAAHAGRRVSSRRAPAPRSCTRIKSRRIIRLSSPNVVRSRLASSVLRTPVGPTNRSAPGPLGRSSIALKRASMRPHASHAARPMDARLERAREILGDGGVASLMRSRGKPESRENASTRRGGSKAPSWRPSFASRHEADRRPGNAMLRGIRREVPAPGDARSTASAVRAARDCALEAQKARGRLCAG